MKMNQSFDSQEQLKAKLKSISDDFFDLKCGDEWADAEMDSVLNYVQGL